jgi:hypothetical protein
MGTRQHFPFCKNASILITAGKSLNMSVAILERRKCIWTSIGRPL